MIETVRVDDRTHLCVEALGAADAPAVLLIGGATWSMDWWDDGLCRLLVERGMRVIRYDPRDTGGSTTYPPGRPGYGPDDFVTDAVAVLDATGVDRAHVVGLSMGGGVAQRVALAHRARVASLTLVSTSPVDPATTGLPGVSPELEALFAAEQPTVDWSDRTAAVDAVVAAERPYAGPGNFDEPRLRALAGRVVDRSTDLEATMTNHFVVIERGDGDGLPLGGLAGLPTLVVHGTADPLLPVEHGRALAAAIPGARLVELEDVGHQLPPPHTWETFADTLGELVAYRPAIAPEIADVDINPVAVVAAVVTAAGGMTCSGRA